MNVESESGWEPSESRPSGNWASGSDEVSVVEMPPARKVRALSTCHAAEVAVCALLLLAIAVLAVVAYCAFSRRKGDYLTRVEAMEEFREMEKKIGDIKGSVVVIERDKDGNVVADSVRDKYVVGSYYVGGVLYNFSVFYNSSHPNHVGEGFILEDKGGVLYVCSVDKKNCSAASVEAAYDRPLNITEEVIGVGDKRYAPIEGNIDTHNAVGILQKTFLVRGDIDGMLKEEDMEDMEERVEGLLRELVEKIKERVK